MNTTSFSQQLVYVALSRVTNIKKLFFVSKDNSNELFYGRKDSTSVSEHEFGRFSPNKLETVSQVLIDFISNGHRIIKDDLYGDVLRRFNILDLSETN